MVSNCLLHGDKIGGDFKYKIQLNTGYSDNEILGKTGIEVLYL